MVEPVSAAIGAGESLIAMSEKLGILERLRRKLMKQPDVASAKLETALFELRSSVGSRQASTRSRCAGPRGTARRSGRSTWPTCSRGSIAFDAIEEAWRQWLPASTTLRESMNRLHDLRAAFIADTGAV